MSELSAEARKRVDAFIRAIHNNNSYAEALAAADASLLELCDEVDSCRDHEKLSCELLHAFVQQLRRHLVGGDTTSEQPK